MAETTDPNKTKDQIAAAHADAGELHAELSLEQLDGMILADDPEFANELKDVKTLTSDGSIDLDVVDLGDSFLEKENPFHHPIGIYKVLAFVLPFLPKLWDLQYRLVIGFRVFRSQFKATLINAGPLLLQASKDGAKNSAEFAKTKIKNFKELSRPLKLVALALILVAGATGAFLYRSFTHGVLPPDKELLTASLEEWAAESYKYEADSEMDSFYDSPRTIQNIMSLPKMVVNVRPSPSSGPNPMAAMEFFLEGLSPEVIVEVKDRETEMRDLFQRTIEDMSYGELDTTEGKQQLTEKLRVALNGHLTKGKIRRVFIKEMVVKP